MQIIPLCSGTHIQHETGQKKQYLHFYCLTPLYIPNEIVIQVNTYNVIYIIILFMSGKLPLSFLYKVF